MLIPRNSPASGREISFATSLIPAPGPARWPRLLQPDATSAIIAAHVLADQFDAGTVKRIDHPSQGFDNAADGTDACLHALDRRQRNSSEFSERFLVDAQ